MEGTPLGVQLVQQVAKKKKKGINNPLCHLAKKTTRTGLKVGKIHIDVKEVYRTNHPGLHSHIPLVP